MKRLVVHILVWLFVAWCLAPFVWQVITSVKPTDDIVAMPTVYWPNQPTGEHYAALFGRKPFARYLFNSFIVSSLSTVICVALAALAAYAVSRLRVRGGAWLLGGLVVVSLFPPIIFFFPLYEMVRAAGLFNNPVALIVPYVTFNLPFAILVLSAFFRQIPFDLEEAARVDGFTRLGILRRIIMPLAAPALATTAILVFIFCWNEFLLALTFMMEDNARTVTAGVASLGGASGYEVPWGPIAASVVISTLPLIVMVILFQRRIIQGLTAGATKG